jgi:transposase InsO family protein
MLLKKNLVRGMNVDPKDIHECIGTCWEQCTLANSKTKPSPKSTSPPTTEMLQVLHTDIMGPMPVTSYDGKRYILTVYDDFSKLASVVCLKTKDEAPAVLVSICNQLEKQLWHAGLKIKAIRSENGGEYINAALEKFTDDMGIDPQHSAP